jgi:CheY-like chemotaxis protein
LARKILLADDSVTAQNMGRKILADAGYDVITVNNGSAALKRINELKPDLIVLDVYMPGYSGLEVCQRIKEQDETAHIPVLLTVGKLEPFKPEEARRVRADAHIVKPFEASELLTAITKLEDRMVPQQAEGSRFSSSSAGVERFDSGSGSGGGSRKSESKTEIDSGWKNRIRFPAKKKKEEPEPAPEDVAAAAGATFRDFRKGKSKTASGVFAVNGPAAEQESQVVPDIPRDITPEELDALSAVAAKLDAPAASSDETAPLAEKAAAEKKVADEPAAVAKAQEGSNPAAVTGPEVETPSAAIEHAGPAMQAVEVEASTVADAKAAAQVYVEQLQNVADDSASAEAEVVPDRRKAQDRRKAEVAEHEVVKPQVVKTEAAESHVSETGYSEPAAAEAVVEHSAAPAQESPSSSASSSPSTSSTSPSSSVEPDDEKIEAAPSEAELTEALRLLTPSTGTANVATSPSNGNAAHSQLLSDEVTGNSSSGPSSGGPRWVADAVALSAEEAAMSLEAEMFRTFATLPTTTDASGPAIPSSGELAPERIIGVSAIAAAVESRMAAAGMGSGAETWSSQHSRSMENAAAEAAAALEASAELLAAASAATPLVDLIGAEVERKIVAEAAEAEKKQPKAKVAEEAPAEEFASATFADAMGKNEIEAAAEATVDAAVDATEQNHDSNTEVGGQDSMGKNGRTKSEKSNLQEAQAVAANAADFAADFADTSVGAAQQSAPVAEEAPKAMAAAADSSASANDARTIANIVDSVMADLRPRIVEEIAKKLAGK